MNGRCAILDEIFFDGQIKSRNMSFIHHKRSRDVQQMTDGGLVLTQFYKVLRFLQPPKPLRSFIPQREGICCFLWFMSLIFGYIEFTLKQLLVMTNTCRLPDNAAVLQSPNNEIWIKEKPNLFNLVVWFLSDTCAL